MSLNSFILRLIILLIPGFISLKMYKTLACSSKEKKRINTWEDVVTILVLSILSYMLLSLFAGIYNFSIEYFNLTISKFDCRMLDAITDEKKAINFLEIFLSMFISIIIGTILSFVSNKKYLIKFFKLLKVTNRFGDEDVWSYINNKNETEWVIIRDYKYDLCYYCYISLFSDSGAQRELLLKEVDVYRNSDSKLLYKRDSLYICRNEYDLSIEIRGIQNETINNHSYEVINEKHP